MLEERARDESLRMPSSEPGEESLEKEKGRTKKRDILGKA